MIPKVLSEIKDTPVPVFELYDILKPELNDATDFFVCYGLPICSARSGYKHEGEVFICL